MEPIWAMGLMCGTSMDGVDAALLRTDGETVAAFGPSLELAPAYNDADKAALNRAATLYADGGAPEGEAADALARLVERAHLAAFTALRARADAPVEAVGFHGQTVFHAPERGVTVQLGDGARLAEMAGAPVVWDFRSADVAAGGEGAPLAPFYHFALARRIGAEAPLCFLNIGGVANVTWVDPRRAAPEEGGALLAFDTGPGNALVDDWMMRRSGEALDRDGAAAAAGRAHADRITLNSAEDYIARTPPKSLDRNAFSMALDRMEGLSTEDGAATLTALTVEAVRRSAAHLPAPPSRWLVCGGGRRNPTLMRMLGQALTAPVQPVEAAGLDGDMLEAQAFAYLAVRVMRSLPISAPSATGVARAMTGGRVSGVMPSE